MPDMQHIESSNLDEAGYDEKTQILEASFLNGGTYRYYGVPKHVWEEFLAGNTPGQYFYHNIRTSYTYIRIGGRPAGSARMPK